MTVSPEDDRHNGWVFTLCYVLIYISAPVLYVGVVQAALCDKLGAGATLANLPASTYMFGRRCSCCSVCAGALQRKGARKR